MVVSLGRFDETACVLSGNQLLWTRVADAGHRSRFGSSSGALDHVSEDAVISLGCLFL